MMQPSDMMRRVIVETPYRATDVYTVDQHMEYLKAAMADCVRRGESPMASHHLLPGGILDDDTPYERQLGIRCGIAWGDVADAIIVYSDLGVSSGMKQAILYYKDAGKIIEWRTLDSRVVRPIRERQP
jgi:hypothetical protein